jgi:hypothetical protein
MAMTENKLVWWNFMMAVVGSGYRGFVGCVGSEDSSRRSISTTGDGLDLIGGWIPESIMTSCWGHGWHHRTMNVNSDARVQLSRHARKIRTEGHAS